MDRHSMDVSLPMHHALFSTCDHSREMQQMGVLSLSSFDHVDAGDVDSHPRHISTQDIQPHGMDVAAS